MKPGHFLLFVVLLMYTKGTSSAELKPLLLVHDKFTPFVDPNLPRAGIATAIVNQVLEEVGYTVELQIMPWARALERVKQGQYPGLVSAWKTKEREQYLIYSHPYMYSHFAVVQNANEPLIKRFSHMRGKKVGLIREYAYPKPLLNDPLINKIWGADLVRQLDILINKRLDLIINEAYVVQYLINQHGYLGKLQLYMPIGKSEAMHLVLSRKHPDAQQVITSFNQALIRQRDAGLLSPLFLSFGLPEPRVNR